MNEDIMKQLGFGREVGRFKAGNCVFCGKGPIDVTADFADEMSRREYEISGICQQCQDEVFNDDEEEEAE